MDCPICWNHLDSDHHRPMTGSCGHSVCLDCSQNLPETACPTCRKEQAFTSPINNYLAEELNEKLISSAHSLERKQGVINDFSSRLETMEVRREMANADELGRLQYQVDRLQRENSDLIEQLRRSEQLSEHYKNQCERISLDVNELKLRNSHLENEIEGFLRREKEHERKMKERDEWDALEDFENVPQPENVTMVLPAMKFISDDTKKQLTDLGVVLIHRADLTSRQLLAASKKQYHQTVVPLMNNLAKKAGEIIAQTQERRN